MTPRPLQTPHDQTASRTGAPTMPTPLARLRALVRTAATVGLILAAFPLHASAASCKPLLQDLATFLATPGRGVSLVHTTNYQANGLWSAAFSDGYLYRNASEPRLAGWVFRDWQHTSTSKAEVDEVFFVEFYVATGEVRFASQYGPYSTSCSGTKFLTVSSGDSFETFSFEKFQAQ